MKNTTHLFLMLTTGILLLIACSKEKKIKKQLAGSWTITQVVTVTTINNGSPSTVTDNSATVTTFGKDGSGTASSSGSGTNPFPDAFTWSNSDATLTIIDTQNPATTIYNVLDNSKKEMILNTTSSEVISGDTYNYDITITMNKD